MTKEKSSVMSDFIAPVGVLLAICIVMSALLAFTNQATAPVIEAAAAEAARAARVEVMPDASDFEEIDVPAGAPDTVKEVYRASNGAGYVISVTTTGYGGKNTLKVMCGIGPDGTITGTKVLEHAETVGLGAKIEGEGYQGQYPGKDASYVSQLSNIDTISGATRSSNFFRLALVDAFAAYDLVKGA